MSEQAEVWLRGLINGYAQELQPVVHVLLQKQLVILQLMKSFSSELHFIQDDK